MSREILHELMDRIPEEEIAAVQRYLESLARTARVPHSSYPPDDEPVTDADAQAIAKGRADFKAGRTVPHNDVLREFGLA